MIGTPMNYTKKHGFTLIELMIVIVILGVLMTIGTFAFQSSAAKGRDARRKSDLEALSKALDMYNNDRGKYPAGDNGIIKGCGAAYDLSCGNMGCSADADPTCLAGNKFWGGNTISSPLAIYMTKLPVEPSYGRRYYYESVNVGSGTNNGFRLYTRLENLQDASIPTTDSKQYSVSCSLSASDVYCNYVVNSGNVPMPTVKP